MATSSIINTDRLTRRYGRRTGVDGLCLDVKEGEVFGFLGPNGAGKTTAIRLLLGFLRPHGGQAVVDGLDCWRESVRIKREVGYLPGDLRLYPWFTTHNALKIVGQIRGRDLTEPGLELAERFGLEPDLPVKKMSRGTRQKLGLVLTMAHQPRLLVLDEPTSGLDPLIQEELERHLRGLAAAGHTVFFSSHTLSEVDRLCDRVAIVREGRLIADEKLDDLRAKAPRSVELVFADDSNVQPNDWPDFLDLTRREGRHVWCELNGPASDLIHWANRQSLADLTISPPDLENLFHKLYQSPDASA